MKRKGRFILILILLSYYVLSNATVVLEASWSDVIKGRCSDQDDAWWSSAEAIRIAENVLLYQKECGGWPKNTNMQLVLTQSQKDALTAAKPLNKDCTIDNGAVDYELTYLSKVYAAISDNTMKTKIKDGFLLGVNYLLNAQYNNGGWPQFYPYRGGYSDHITYNDNAMVHVMYILKHIYTNDGTYSVEIDNNIKTEAESAFNKGIECILNTQYIQKNKLTVWCAQHNYITLEPVMARSYELASLSGSESAEIIKLLMNQDNPSKEIIRAIYSAVTWYDRNRIKGQKLVSFVNSDGLTDKHIIFDPTAPDMWGRFYTLEDNRPFFCDRDGIMKFSIAEIGYERRNGYSWYNSSGFDVINNYEKWLPVKGSSILASPLPDTKFLDTDTIPVMAFANQYTGSTLKNFELIMDSQTINTYSAYSIEATLSGLSLGEHTLMIKTEYVNGHIETDTVTFEVSLPTYMLTVQRGTGDGEFCEGSIVTIDADAASSGKVFEKWTGDTLYIQNIYSASTSVNMPDKNISVTARYKYVTNGIFSVYERNNGLICYPNPASQGFIVELAGKDVKEITIYNIQNRKVYVDHPTGTQYYINSSQLNSGIYFVQVTDQNNERFVRKIVIKKF